MDLSQEVAKIVGDIVGRADVMLAFIYHGDVRNAVAIANNIKEVTTSETPKAAARQHPAPTRILGGLCPCRDGSVEVRCKVCGEQLVDDKTVGAIRKRNS